MKKEEVVSILKGKHDLAVLTIIFVIGLLIVLTIFRSPFSGVISGNVVSAPACRDGIDNDGDNKIDYPNDPGCSGRSDSSELNPKIECDDGLDNDRDTARDYPSDPGCSGLRDRSEKGSKACDDGRDNDLDGTIDYPSDPGCSSLTDTTEKSSLECDDGIDNDKDGLMDSRDPGCSGVSDNDESNCGDNVCEGEETYNSCQQDCQSAHADSSERGTSQCNNGVDESFDADSLTDYPNDPGCSSPSDPYETDGQCDDKYDNDNDGYYDYPNDPECKSYSTYNEEDCADTDGGITTSVSGTVSGNRGGKFYSYRDFCLTSNTIREYHCANMVSSVDTSCGLYGSDFTGDSTSCSDGACVSVP